VTDPQIPIERVVRALEQQFPRELTIAIQQVRIELLQEALNGHDPQDADAGSHP
jgi:hypothetical protein